MKKKNTALDDKKKPSRTQSGFVAFEPTTFQKRIGLARDLRDDKKVLKSSVTLDLEEETEKMKSRLLSGI